MIHNNKARAALLAAAFTTIAAAPAGATPDNDAPRIALKLSCDTGEQNCFDTDNGTTNGTIADMLSWIWTVRAPSAGNPLIIDIDPGTYQMPANTMFCSGGGHVTTRGSGIDTTVLTGGARFQIESSAVVAISDCTNLTFENFTILADGEASDTAVSWTGAGSSTWSAMSLEGRQYGWFDSPDNGVAGSLHYWFGSKVRAMAGGPNSNLNVTGYYSKGGEAWFYGGEMAAINDGNTESAVFNLSGLMATPGSDIHVFGTAIRSATTANALHFTSGFGHNAILAVGGLVHVHGGVISSTSKAGFKQDVRGIQVMDFAGGIPGFVHTPGTGFNLVASGNGKMQRLVVSGSGSVQSPFTWPSGTVPPAGANSQLVSITGQDMFVETDCDVSGNCTGSGNPQHPHLMLYDASCATDGPWFNVVLNRCRGE